MRTVTPLRQGFVAWLSATTVIAGSLGAQHSTEIGALNGTGGNPFAGFVGWAALWFCANVPLLLGFVALERMARNHADAHAELLSRLPAADAAPPEPTPAAADA